MPENSVPLLDLLASPHKTIYRSHRRDNGQLAGGAVGDHAGEELVRAVRLRYTSRRGSDAVVARGERLASADRHGQRGLSAQVRSPRRHAQRARLRGPFHRQRNQNRWFRSTVERWSGVDLLSQSICLRRAIDRS